VCNLTDVELGERKKQLESVKYQIAEGKKNYIKEKTIHKNKILGLSREIESQKEHNHKLRQILLKVKEQKSTINSEIETLQS
jgi:hypothetical protein